MNVFLKYFLQRINEASTWRGIAYAITGYFGYTLSDVQATSIIALGMAIVGVFQTFIPDKLGDAPK